MFPANLSLFIARERQHDLRRSARRQPVLDGGTPVTRVTLRWAAARDKPRLRDLASLDDAVPPAGAALVAEVDGRLRAALPLDGSAPIVDPSHCGSDLIELLRLRAAQLGRA